MYYVGRITNPGYFFVKSFSYLCSRILFMIVLPETSTAMHQYTFIFRFMLWHKDLQLTAPPFYIYDKSLSRVFSINGTQKKSPE